MQTVLLLKWKFYLSAAFCLCFDKLNMTESCQCACPDFSGSLSKTASRAHYNSDITYYMHKPLKHKQ